MVILAVPGNAGKTGTVVLLSFSGLFAIIIMIAGEKLTSIFNPDADAEVIVMCVQMLRISGLFLLISSATTYGLYLAIKNRPWFISLICTGVIGVAVIVVGVVSTRSIMLTITTSTWGIMIPFANLLPLLRVVNTEIQKESPVSKQGMEGNVLVATKSKVVSALLAFFLGTMGVHRYYLGYKKQGIIQTCGFVSLIIGYAMYIPAMLGESAGMLIFSALFLLYGAGIGIWAFVDFIRILTGGLTPADGSTYTENRSAQVQFVQTAPSTIDNADALEKLAKFHEQGILTDDEFQQKKADILAKM